jgi:hypothetical protein
MRMSGHRCKDTVRSVPSLIKSSKNSSGWQRALRLPRCARRTSGAQITLRRCRSSASSALKNTYCFALYGWSKVGTPRIRGFGRERRPPLGTKRIRHFERGRFGLHPVCTTNH